MSKVRGERRIGKRVPRPGLGVSWTVMSGRWPRRSTEVFFGTVLDVSITGALVETPVNVSWRYGQRIAVDIGGLSAVVEARRRQVSADGQTLRFGLLFCSMEDELESLIRHLNRSALDGDRLAEWLARA